MKTNILFSGLSFEVGQSKSGLTLSSQYARHYFSYLQEMGLNLIDKGDSSIPNLNEKVKVHSDDDLKNIEWKKYSEAYSKTKELLNAPYPLLNWGGDHSVALVSVGAFVNQNPDGHVIWIDAHADLNLPKHSDSGNIHGMPLAILDAFELNVIESLEIKAFHYKDVQKLGMAIIAKRILEMTKNDPVHISFDIDSVDPKFAPSTGVPVRLGLTPNDLDILGEELFKKSDIRSLDIVEVNPELGSTAQVERTYLIAFNFLRSVFKNIYHGETYDGIGKRDYGLQFTQV